MKRKGFQWYAVEALKITLDAALLIVVYLEVLPYIINRLYESIGYTATSYSYVSQVYPAVLVGISILTVSARLLKGEFLEPVLRASANLMGVLYALSYLGTKTLIDASNLSVGGYNVDIKFDIGPLLLIFFGFFVAPGVIMPFISYYYKK